jgi:integrase
MPDFSLVQIRTSPNYYIQWFENGHTQRASTRTADRGEAEAVLAAFRLVKADAPVTDLTVPQVLDWYWDHHAKKLMRPESADLAIRYLKPFFGATLAENVTLDMQEQYAAARREQGGGDESIRRDLSVLSAACRRAVKYKKLAHAPPILSIAPAPPRERWLTRKEVARLFRQMRRPVRNKVHRHVLLFARLALYTGARTGAILDLTWDRVDFDADMIDFRKPGRRVTKKRRTLTPMTPMLRRMLKHAHARSRSRYVVSWAGEGIGRVAKAFVAHAEKAGLEDVSPHVMRHTFASWAVQKGVPIYTVGKALGQTVASTTSRYAKLAPDDVRAAMQAMQRK